MTLLGLPAEPEARAWPLCAQLCWRLVTCGAASLGAPGTSCPCLRRLARRWRWVPGCPGPARRRAVLTLSLWGFTAAPHPGTHSSSPKFLGFQAPGVSPEMPRPLVVQARPQAPWGSGVWGLPGGTWRGGAQQAEAMHLQEVPKQGGCWGQACLPDSIWWAGRWLWGPPPLGTLLSAGWGALVLGCRTLG